MLSAVPADVGRTPDLSIRLIEIALDPAELATRQPVAGSAEALLFTANPTFGLLQPPQFLVVDLAGLPTRANAIDLSFLPCVDAGRTLRSLRLLPGLLRECGRREGEQASDGGKDDASAHETLLVACDRSTQGF
jgi:hypothetical protein